MTDSQDRDDEITDGTFVGGYVLDSRGVTSVRFRQEGGSWVNAERIDLEPGAMLDLGGMTMRNGDGFDIEYTFHLHDGPDDT